MEINQLNIRKIIDSRTNSTVEGEINNNLGKAPSGASTGIHEVKCFVPDNIKELEKKLQDKFKGKDFSQEEFDNHLSNIDGTDDFSKIGATSISLSFAFKNSSGIDHTNQFPLPLSNIIGGGEHGGNTSIQEFLVLPIEAETFPEAIEINVSIYQEIKNRHDEKVEGINDEGALITTMDDEETLELLNKVAKKRGARIGLDIAASEFYEEGKYKMDSMGLEGTPEEHLEFVQSLIDKHDLIYVEDPFDEEDFEKHAELTSQNPDVLICGDDLFVTNKERLKTGIDQDSCNSLIVKPNQIGTVTDTRETVKLAKEENYVPVISHRSGETTDHTISDLALEWEIPIIKAGIADIRIAKLNPLLRYWDKQENPEINQNKF